MEQGTQSSTDIAGTTVAGTITVRHVVGGSGHDGSTVLVLSPQMWQAHQLRHV
jgi:hypothetical protein